ncbi:MAG: beta-lactamase [Steroidobacteraceae bacterium]|nr:beta-lactamase [Steroidobacteraceae bacterium]
MMTVPRLAAALLVALCAVTPTHVLAQASLAPPQAQPPVGPPPTPPTPPAPTAAVPESAAPTPQLTATDAGTWLDGFMPNALKQADIAGAVVAVVKDGAVLLERGYGYADVEHETPMEPGRTLVRPGSVSKLFTWTAVMQQVEQGRIDLDADVNQYLDFEIPAYEGKPVTMRNIMTHTAGFEETLKHLLGAEGDPMPGFEVILKERVPARIFAPGTTSAYSNYGCALAGYIVQRVSGVPFDDYMEKNIFGPLGMTSTTFRQPLPEDWKPRMATGYEAASQRAQKFELVGPAPAGSVSTTAADMARFMIAHLQDAARLMHGTPLTILPRVNRMLLGFYESTYDGRRMIAHGGDTNYFHSDLNLFLDHGVGLFVSFNSLGKDGAAHPLRGTLLEEFADRYFPVPDTKATPLDEKTAREHAGMIAGHYVNTRRVETTFMSLLNLASETKVEANDDGTISVSMFLSPTGAPLRWREVEPFVWRQEHETALLVGEVRGGRVVRFSTAEYAPIMFFERPAASKSGAWLLPAGVVALAALLLTALAWPVSALVRRYYRVAPTLSVTDAAAQRWMRVVATVTTLAWAGWVGLIVAMITDFTLLAPKADPWLYLLQVIGAIVFVGGTLVGLWAAWTTIRGSRGALAKAWAVLLVLALLVSLWIAAAFHLLAFGAKY